MLPFGAPMKTLRAEACGTWHGHLAHDGLNVEPEFCTGPQNRPLTPGPPRPLICARISHSAMLLANWSYTEKAVDQMREWVLEFF